MNEGWSETREYRSTGLFALGLLLVILLLCTMTGQWDDLPVQIGNVVGVLGAWTWPIYVMSRHRRQQDRILDKIRANYILGISQISTGNTIAAKRCLKMVRRLEAHWRLGASRILQLILHFHVLATATALAVAGHACGLILTASRGPGQIAEAIDRLWAMPWQVAPAIGIAFMQSWAACQDAFQIRFKPWSEFYGDCLQRTLDARYDLATAGHHEFIGLPEGASARELFGLGAVFTKIELRRAWLRLARELHPDRWISARPAMRRMKEDALKRVNAARDELLPQAL